MDEYKSFLTKLTMLSKETGVIIEEFGDPLYNPRLVANDTDENIFICWDKVRKEYVARKDNPYDGEVLY